MAFCVAWTLFSHHILKSFSSNATDVRRTLYDSTPLESPPNFLRKIHDTSFKLMMQESLLLATLVVPAGSVYFIWEFRAVSRNLGPLRKFAKLVRQGFRTLSGPLQRLLAQIRDYQNQVPMPSWAESTVARTRKIYRFIKRFGVHILVLSFATIFYAIPAFFFLGFPARIFYQSDFKAHLIDTLIVGIINIFIAGGTGAGCCVGMVSVISLLVEPFRTDWEAPGYERTFLEF